MKAMFQKDIETEHNLKDFFSLESMTGVEGLT